MLYDVAEAVRSALLWPEPPSYVGAVFCTPAKEIGACKKY